MSKKFLLFCAVAVVALLAVPLLAQTSTAGGLTGTVADASGAVLPGVTVELSGPAMQGARTAVTDSQGTYRFANVPPGDNYKITASLAGFAPVTKTVQRVFLGQEGTVNFTLRAAVSEAITVTAEAPLVDVSHTTTGVNITSQQFETLPTQRSFQQLTQMAPGVSMDMSDTRGGLGGVGRLANSPTVGASSAPENNYIIDGLSTTDTRNGTSGANVTMNFVQEVQVMTGGYSAEYGRSTGGVFNVLTKSGGNEFSGDAFGYFRPKAWVATNINSRAKGTSRFNNVTDNRDYGFDLGGPILKDRLWFFGAYDPSRQQTSRGALLDEATAAVTRYPGTDFTTKVSNYAAKLTAALNPNHHLVATTFGDPTKQDGWLGPTAAEPSAALANFTSGSNNAVLRYNGILSARWLLEANAGRHTEKETRRGATEAGRLSPAQLDRSPSAAIYNFRYGGWAERVDNKAYRNIYSLKMSNYFTKHELRYGIDYERKHYTADRFDQSFSFYGPTKITSCRPACPGISGTIQDQLRERIYTINGTGQNSERALFFQDSWKVLPNVQLNLGVRWEEQALGAGGGVPVARNQAELDAADAGNPVTVGTFTLKNNWAPRLGLTWDPLNNGRSKVYAFAGRFFESIPLDMNLRSLNGESYIFNRYFSTTKHTGDSWVNRAGTPLTKPGENWVQYRANPLVARTPVDPTMKAQYQDEFILGGEYQFAPAWSFGVRLVDRELKRVIEDIGVFLDPTDPILLTSYVISNPGEAIWGSKCPPCFPKPKRYYRAAEITLQRARSNNWHLNSSFVYARARGNYEGLYLTGYEQLDPNITAFYDIPSMLVNATGRMSADRPYLFKIYSGYTFPFGLTVSEGFNLSAGQPYSMRGPELYNNYSDGNIFFTSRGSAGRTPTYHQLDLHADYALPVWRTRTRGLSLIVDAFNVTNSHKALEVDQDYVYEGMPGIEPWEDPSNLDAFGNPKFNASFPHSAFFATPIRYQNPRQLQAGVKLSF